MRYRGARRVRSELGLFLLLWLAIWLVTCVVVLLVQAVVWGFGRVL